MTHEPSGATAVGARERLPGSHPALRDAAAVLGVPAVLGLLGAVLWWLLVDPATFTAAPGGGLGMNEVELGKRFNDDGWFVVIGAVTGLFAGAGLTWWRSRDPLLTAVLLLPGSALGVLVMSVVGGWLGPDAPASVAAGADAAVPVPLEVTGFVSYLVWPITALVGALLVLWSPAPVPAARHDDAEAADGPTAPR